jgi:hypothetical protein
VTAIDLAVIGFASPPGRGIQVEIINDDLLVAAVHRSSCRRTFVRGPR